MNVSRDHRAGMQGTLDIAIQNPEYTELRSVLQPETTDEVSTASRSVNGTLKRSVAVPQWTG